MFPATVFDYNGVLVDDEHVHLEAFREVLAPLGIELGEAAYWERYLGFDDAGAFRAILEDAGRKPSDAQVDDLIEQKRPVYLRRARESLRPFAGAADLLHRCLGHGPVGIVSGALRDEILLGLDVLGVAGGQIAFIVAAEDTRASKPDPEGYRIAIDKLTASTTAERARQALVIEDSLAGVEAAKGAGLACLGVAHSYPAEQLTAAGADQVFQSIADVTDEALATLKRRLG